METYLFLWAIISAFIVIQLYIWYLDFKFWATRKLTLLWAALQLFRSKDKAIREIAWQTIRLVFWETKDKDELKKDIS